MEQGRRGITDQAGQMLMPGFHGREVGDDIKSLILDYGIGGVILFTRNIESPSQLLDLTAGLRELSRQRNPDIPLFIAIDQEGGRVARLPPPFRQYPSYRELAEKCSDDVVRDSMEQLASELVSVGVTMNMAPVLDVDTNPANPIIGDRSFGPDPHLVGRLGCVVIEAFRRKGIIPVGKHFPGHGDTVADSHFDLPVVKKTVEELEEVELVPFRTALKKGLPAIMTAHILFPEIDPAYPATVSSRILSELLRKRLGFEGVVMSDDLEMKGISEKFERDEVVSRGVEAGIDIFLCCHTLEYQKRVVKKIEKLMEQGGEWEKKIRASLQRIRCLKKDLV